MKDKTFKKMSYVLQDKIDNFSGNKKNRIKRKIEDIWNDIYQVLWYKEKNNFDFNNMERLLKEIEFEKIDRTELNNRINKKITSVLIKLWWINVWYLSFEENNLKYLITSNYVYPENFSFPEEYIKFLKKIYEVKLDKENIDFIKDQYIWKLNLDNQKILKQLNIELVDIEEPYIWASIFYKYILDNKNNKKKNIFFEATYTSFNFYIKILNILKNKNIIKNYVYEDNIELWIKIFKIIL